jgi:hypothetical protein
VADFTQQPDGTWTKAVKMSTGHVIANCALRTSDMSYGVHIVMFSDTNGHVLAQGFYQMVAPIVVHSATSANHGWDIECDHPADVTMQIYLPSSIQNGDVLTERIDQHLVVGTITVDKTQLARQDDGTWLYTRTASAADIGEECTTSVGTANRFPLGSTGTNQLEVIDQNGYVLSEGDYNTLGGTPTIAPPTPTPAQIRFVPALFSCTAPSDLTFTVQFPASVKAGDQIWPILAGPPDAPGMNEWPFPTTVTVGPATMAQEADGTWLYTRTFPVAQTRRMCAGNGTSHDYASDPDLVGLPFLTPGLHTLKLKYVGGGIDLAEGYYTVAPYPQTPATPPSIPGPNS